jgi:hypothetical protein
VSQHTTPSSADPSRRQAEIHRAPVRFTRRIAPAPTDPKRREALLAEDAQLQNRGPMFRVIYNRWVWRERSQHGAHDEIAGPVEVAGRLCGRVVFSADKTWVAFYRLIESEHAIELEETIRRVRGSRDEIASLLADRALARLRWHLGGAEPGIEGGRRVMGVPGGNKAGLPERARSLLRDSRVSRGIYEGGAPRISKLLEKALGLDGWKRARRCGFSGCRRVWFPRGSGNPVYCSDSCFAQARKKSDRDRLGNRRLSRAWKKEQEVRAWLAACGVRLPWESRERNPKMWAIDRLKRGDRKLLDALTDAAIDAIDRAVPEGRRLQHYLAWVEGRL